MSVASEITRLQDAKASLKTSINAKNDNSHQITNETLEDYASFVDNIPSGGGVDINDYFKTSGFSAQFNVAQAIKKIPSIDLTDVTSILISNAINVEEVVGFTNTSSLTSIGSAFNSCDKIVSIPLFDTSNVENMSYTFYGCTNLQNVPLFATNKVTNFQNMFYLCPNITDNSMNNILQMCINATLYNGTKTLRYIGFNNARFASARVEALSNYQDFLNAGWTIGY